jgi:hypothetical protein
MGQVLPVKTAQRRQATVYRCRDTASRMQRGSNNAHEKRRHQNQPAWFSPTPRTRDSSCHDRRRLWWTGRLCGRLYRDCLAELRLCRRRRRGCDADFVLIDGGSASLDPWAAIDHNGRQEIWGDVPC